MAKKIYSTMQLAAAVILLNLTASMTVYGCLTMHPVTAIAFGAMSYVAVTLLLMPSIKEARK